MKIIMKLKIFLSIFFIVILSGCATESKYREVLKSWIGASESELISSWGPPDSVYENNKGGRILTYKAIGNFFIPGTSPTYQTTIIGNTAYTTSHGGYPSQNITTWCNTYITVRKGKITRWSYKGNNCVSY